MNYIKRCWAEIDLNAVKNNFCVLQNKLHGALPMPVVKADAYEHGALIISCLLQEKYGVEAFAVSNLDEARQLRKGGIKGLLLILGYTPVEEAKELSALGVTQTLLSAEYAEQLNRQAQRLGVTLSTHIAVDTGMSRIGFPWTTKGLKDLHWSNLKVEGVFTHLCHADSTDPDAREFTKQQVVRFEEATAGMTGRHIQNTAGVLTDMGAGYDYARLGIALYGLSPSAEVTDSQLQPVMSLKSAISMIKTIPVGTTVGYSRTWRAERETVVATVPVGYADGYPHILSNRAEVLVHGQRAKVIGAICMDQLMLDVTGIEVAIGDEVTLLGRDGAESITAQDLAEQAGTIGYEIVCMVSKRVPRVFCLDGAEIDVQLWLR